jgi:ATP-dependent RNA helicase DDX31/DBP7
MADDGMLMNFEIGDAPILPKQTFSGGRWKDRLAAKKVAQKKAVQRSTSPSTREIFNDKRHQVAAEEYIGPNTSPRPPKRQRVDNDFARNANTAAVISGKLPAGSIKVGGTKDYSLRATARKHKHRSGEGYVDSRRDKAWLCVKETASKEHKDWRNTG